MKVKYLPRGQIEAASLSLLDEYGCRFGAVRRPPIPAEEIMEWFLELELGFDDLPRRLGMPDVLGATWVGEKRVLIDESLDPTLPTVVEGRYRFTVAHEIGHWQLHRRYFQNDPAQASLFTTSAEPSIVCRTGSRKDPMEWQADYFAGQLLMPKEMVFGAWEARYGSLEPYVAVDEIDDLSARWSLAEDRTPTVSAARELAEEFGVSGQAMQIRLLGLRLIKTEQPAPDLFTRAKQK